MFKGQLSIIRVMSSSSSPVDPSPDHVREVLSKLRSAFSIPSLKEIRWNDNRGTLESGLVEAVWSQPCLASLKTQNMTTFESIINPQVGRSAFGVPMPEEPRIQGRCQGRKVTIHQTKNDKGTDVQVGISE